MEGKGKASRPWKARWIMIGIAVVALLVYGAGSFVYVEAFGADRDHGTLVIGVSTALAADAVRLGQAFSAGEADRKVVVVDATGATLFDTAAGGSPATARVDVATEGSLLAGLLRDGLVDYVFAEGQALAGLESASDLAGATGFNRADLLSLPFPSARVAASLEEARAIVAAGGGSAAGLPTWAAGIEVIGLGDRTPDRQLLEVDGVYPTRASVLDGTYPLSSEAKLMARRPQGFLSLLAHLPFARGWAQPNAAVIGEFDAWLATPEAEGAFYGASQEITLAAVGDVMLGRKTGREIDQFGLDYPFGLVAERLSSADITFCNLEAPLGTTGTMLPGKEIWLRGRLEYVQCLKLGGIDIVNLANNHILDYDSPCLLETLDILDQNGIAHGGAGVDNVASRRPAILEADGIKVAFLGYTEFADPGLFWSFSYRRSFVATETLPGCNPLDMAMVAEDVARAKTEADLVVVVYHWGMEDIPYPQPFNPLNDLETIARQTIDLGANVVLGTHPHAVQGYETYGGGLISYSLGNFVNDQNRETQKESMILELQMGPSGVLSARVTPCWIISTQPRFMQGDEARLLLEKIEEISAGFRDHR